MKHLLYLFLLMSYIPLVAMEHPDNPNGQKCEGEEFEKGKPSKKQKMEKKAPKKDRAGGFNKTLQACCVETIFENRDQYNDFHVLMQQALDFQFSEDAICEIFEGIDDAMIMKYKAKLIGFMNNKNCADSIKRIIVGRCAEMTPTKKFFKEDENYFAALLSSADCSDALKRQIATHLEDGTIKSLGLMDRADIPHAIKCILLENVKDYWTIERFRQLASEGPLSKTLIRIWINFYIGIEFFDVDLFDTFINQEYNSTSNAEYKANLRRIIELLPLEGFIRTMGRFASRADYGVAHLSHMITDEYKAMREQFFDEFEGYIVERSKTESLDAEIIDLFLEYALAVQDPSRFLVVLTILERITDVYERCINDAIGNFNTSKQLSADELEGDCADTRDQRDILAELQEYCKATNTALLEQLFDNPEECNRIKARFDACTNKFNLLIELFNAYLAQLRQTIDACEQSKQDDVIL